MEITTLTAFLGWSSVGNYIVLLIWAWLYTRHNAWLYQEHSRFFALTHGQFTLFHYAGMGLYKLLILVLNLVPFVVLKLISG